MALKQQIDDDLKAALMSGDRLRAQVLRGLKAVILNEEVAGGSREEGLDDVSIEQAVAREVKKRNESAKIYDDADRKELAENERIEAEILSVYLPKQLSEEEIKEVINKVIGEMGVKDQSAMGQVIGAVKKELGNAADGSVVARLVKEALQ